MQKSVEADFEWRIHAQSAQTHDLREPMLTCPCIEGRGMRMPDVFSEGKKRSAQLWLDKSKTTLLRGHQDEEIPWVYVRHEGH